MTTREELEAIELCNLRDHSCVRCGMSQFLHTVHRRNWLDGGVTVVWNLQRLCMSCHTWRNEHEDQATRDGYAIPAGDDDTSEYPARRLVHGVHRWVIYGGGCTYSPISDDKAAAIRARLKGGGPIALVQSR